MARWRRNPANIRLNRLIERLGPYATQACMEQTCQR
jgi:hypothetical protein